MPAYAKNLLPSSVLSRQLEGEAPTIELAVGYSKSNISPILKLFLSRLDELRTRSTDVRVGFSGIAPCRPSMACVMKIETRTNIFRVECMSGMSAQQSEHRRS
jgi:hypothetical protein